MYQNLKKLMGVTAAFSAMVLWVGITTVGFAQGSGSKPSGSATKTADEHQEKVEVKAELNAEALKAIIGAKVPMVVLDTRGPAEQWIAGAVPLDHDADEQSIRRTLANHDQLIVTYCGGPQCPMSLMLANRLI